MNLEEARARATGELRRIESAELPLALAGNVAERSWCWIFGFNSVSWLTSERFDDFIPSGPIVVNKDRSETWIAPSAPPLTRHLDDYADKHGYPRD
jgi:Immunity protein 35